MGKKGDSDCVRVHLKEGDGALCMSGAKMNGWSYSEDPKNVTCQSCLRVHIRVLNGRMEAMKEVQKEVHLGWGVGNTSLCGKEGTKTGYLKSTTCPACLLEHIRTLKDDLVEHGNQLIACKKALESIPKDREQAWSVANKRIEEIVEITAREQNALAALRAVAKLV